MVLTLIVPNMLYFIRSLNKSELSKQLASMGLNIGTPVTLVTRAGNDVVIRYGNTRIAMNETISRNIIV